MNTNEDHILADLTIEEVIIESTGTKKKVNSYTQVEAEFGETEIRSIVGQEDFYKCNVFNRPQDLDIKKPHNRIRPPLIGQASSSSYDNGFSAIGKHSSSLEQNIMPYRDEFDDQILDLHDNNFPGTESTANPCLINRDEYINQRPPEGSSVQINVMTPPVDDIQDFTKIQSSSSASSVTSSRPLEWDSGADVGYNQLHNNSVQVFDNNMSTIERMALVCGTNLLTRSDPEGTTGPNGQPRAVTSRNPVQSYFKYKEKIGYPNAESTRENTCVSSNVSPDMVGGDVLSPISTICETVDKVLVIKQPLSTLQEVSKLGCIINHSSPLPTSQENIKSKCFLFPEINDSETKNVYPPNADDIELDTNNLYQSDGRLKGMVREVRNILHSQDEDRPYNSKVKKADQLFTSDNETSLSCDNGSKKLSSSLEDISLCNNLPSGDRNNSYTLPRRHSHSNLQTNKISKIHKATEIINSEYHKYNMALHSVIQCSKSASSSSVATVVHRKDGTLKCPILQMPILSQERIGFHGCKNEDLSIENQNVSKSMLVNNSIRSNYFICPEKPKTNVEMFSSGNGLTKGGTELKATPFEPISHSHSGIPCSGAHRKIPVPVNMSLNPLQDDQIKCRINQMANNSSSTLNKPVDQNQDLPNKHSNKLVLITSTIDSVESSAKSCGFWTDKQYSVTIEDRVNSFEYLPGDLYQISGRQQPVDSHGTSSISIQNQTSNNGTPDEQCKSLNSSASASSTLERDVQRCVEIISDFIKGSCANNSVLKNKLIRQMVQKLITKNYVDDTNEPLKLTSNVPWVPPRPPNPTYRNGRETRRCNNRSKVPCEFSSRSEKSEISNASSECFIPRPAASSANVNCPLKSKNKATGQTCHSSTSEVLESSSQQYPLGVKTRMINNRPVSKVLTDSSSSISGHNRNWKEPVTRTEKLLEERNKIQSASELNLVQYLNMERENQLYWIQSEIQHLSNLKELLEKQEELKKGVKSLNHNREQSEILKKSVLREKNNRSNKKLHSFSSSPEVQKKKKCSKKREQISTIFKCLA